MQLIAVSSQKELEKATYVQPTIPLTGEPRSLAKVELHPILCPNATTATCVPHISSAHPAPGRLLVEEVEGSIKDGMVGWGELPSHLEDCECGVCMCMCVTVSE